MNIDGKAWRTIWLEAGGRSIGVIDQTQLPHHFTTRSLASLDQAAEAIRTMVVRGAPLIGVTGAYGLMLALQADPSDGALAAAFTQLLATRPTAVNLQWALERVLQRVLPLAPAERAPAAQQEAGAIADEDVQMCEAIGDHGLGLFQELAARRPANRQKEPLNVLTHCNAGWLATVDWGTALAPIYKAHRAGMAVHVWVDETRPAQPGRQPRPPSSWASDGVPAHRDRRQRRRPSDAARPGRCGDRGHGSHHPQRRCLQQDRHRSQGPRRPRQRRAVLRGPAGLHH
jgi:methylthioribose-1-phosphate isomerase